MRGAGARGSGLLRIQFAFGLALMAAVPAVLVWANRSLSLRPPGDPDAVEDQAAQAEARRLAASPLPPGHMPAPENSPFGGAFTPKRWSGASAEDALPSSIGDLDWDLESDPAFKALKPGLRLGQDEATKSPKGRMRPGLDLIRISRAAVEAGRLDEVMNDVAREATILSVLQNRTLLIKVEASRMHALRSLDGIDRTAPFHPAF